MTDKANPVEVMDEVLNELARLSNYAYDKLDGYDPSISKTTSFEEHTKISRFLKDLSAVKDFLVRKYSSQEGPTWTL